MSDELLRALVREVVEELSEKEGDSSGGGEEDVGRPRKEPKNRLASWLDSHQDGMKKMKRATNRTPATLNKYARYEVTPPLKVAKDIEDMTNIPMDYWAQD